MSAPLEPGQIPEDHARAHRRLADALLSLPERDVLPCRLDDRFISENAAERAEAADLCLDCPVFAACQAAGAFEKFGVWGGVDRTPVRAPQARRRAA